MAITQLQRKPQVAESRKERIDTFFKSKQRFPQVAFLEGEFLITTSDNKKYFERGYSKPFNPTNDFELKNAWAKAIQNALAKIFYRNGYIFTESDEIKLLSNKDKLNVLVNGQEIEVKNETQIDSIRNLDYLFYYSKFKDTDVILQNDKGFSTVTFKQKSDSQQYIRDEVKDQRQVNGLFNRARDEF